MINDQFSKIKILQLGDQQVGKSSIVKQFQESKFTEQYEPTVGVDFVVKAITLLNQQQKVHILDVSGQYRYRSLLPQYIKDSNFLILCYDVTNEQSFLNLENWLKDIHDISQDHFTIVLANKIDQKIERVISPQAGQQFCFKHNLIYQEVSAKEAKNIYDIFLFAVKQFIEKKTSDNK